jgi:hypothetical protein
MTDPLGTEAVPQDVLLGFPVYDGKTEVEIAQEIYLSLYDKRVPIRKVHYYNGDSLVTRARNATACAFMDMPECEYLMFIDSDIRFQRWQVKRLREHDKPIVGGMYLKKKLPYQPVCNHKLGEEGNLSLMREIGTGFMMIRRDVFDAMKEAFPERKYKPYAHERQSENYYDFFAVGKDEDTGYYLSEDYYFCKLARELGYNIYLDEDILVEHSGKMLYPTKDTDLVQGANVLVGSWRGDAPMEDGLLENIKELHETTQRVIEERSK